MKIAFIIPSLINEGPVIVAKDIIEGLINKVALIDVYYFDVREDPLFFLVILIEFLSLRK